MKRTWSADGYRIGQSRPRKLWIPYSGLRWPPPRLKQLLAIVECWVRHHDWTTWQIDDYDGPGELLDPADPDSFMPWLSRESRHKEYGSRACARCGLWQQREPIWRD